MGDVSLVGLVDVLRDIEFQLCLIGWWLLLMLLIKNMGGK